MLRRSGQIKQHISTIDHVTEQQLFNRLCVFNVIHFVRLKNFFSLFISRLIWKSRKDVYY